MEESDTAELNVSGEEGTEEENNEYREEDEALKKEEKRRKSRLRKRGPYRKSHTNW